MTEVSQGTKPSRAEARGLFWGFLGVALFSLTLPATRIAVVDMTPVMVGLGRALVAAAVALAILLAARQRLPRAEEWRRLAVVAAGVVLGFPLLSAWAMQSVPAAHGGVVLGFLPLATALAGAILLRERPSPGFWAFSLLGGGAVVTFSLLRGGGTIGPGHLALLGSVACAAVGYAEGARLSKTLGGWQVICWALVIAAPFLVVPVGLTIAEEGLQAAPASWAAFLYVALFSQLIGFFAWYHGLAVGGVARVSQVQLFQTFLTIFASAVLLGEVIDVMTLGFAVFVVGIVALGRRTRVR